MRPSPGACRQSIVLASLFLARLAVATDDAPETQTVSSAQLDEMVAPIALYPDSLLTQIFIAATYPLEVVEAARWQRKNASLKDDALDEQPWDDSVRWLVYFPDVLQHMSENLDWTKDLGDAFLGQKADLMDAVQRMRAKAHDAGNLKTTPQQPGLSAMPGQFLLKDVVLLGAAVWSLGEALTAPRKLGAPASMPTG